MNRQASRWVILFIFLFGYSFSPTFAQVQEKQSDSQITYAIPAGSSDNKLQLVLSNTTGHLLENISVKVDKKPSWLQLSDEEIEISKLSPNKERTVSFSFGITGNAPIGDTAAVRFIASNDSGFSWEKIIQLRPDAPSEFELLSNYPNPFNPSTTIRYRLPAQMEVKVTIYNILGRKVATLADGIQEAGKQELNWNASNMASGLYFYRVIAEGSEGKRIVENRKMMLIK